MILIYIYAALGLLIVVCYRWRKNQERNQAAPLAEVPTVTPRYSYDVTLVAAAMLIDENEDRHWLHEGIEASECDDFFFDDDNWMTDPLRSYMPGNIYYNDYIGSPGATCICSGSDWITDPTCSYMYGNIYHSDDMFSSTSGIDSSIDTWSDTSTSISSTDDW